MYIRKQNIFTEKKIFPYAKMEDLRLDCYLNQGYGPESCGWATSMDSNG